MTALEMCNLMAIRTTVLDMKTFCFQRDLKVQRHLIRLYVSLNDLCIIPKSLHLDPINMRNILKGYSILNLNLNNNHNLFQRMFSIYRHNFLSGKSRR